MLKPDGRNYSITCNNCDKKYIDETLRNFKRLREHQRDVLQTTHSIRQLLNDNSDFKNATLITIENNLL